jgi:hypothetical protein
MSLYANCHGLATIYGSQLPLFLTELWMDCWVAEAIRYFLCLLHRGYPAVELAFLLYGRPPAIGRPARVTDVQPMDSESSLTEVHVAPTAVVGAAERLLARHKGGTGEILGIAHSHPNDNKPYRSETDREWHSDCLDLNYRETLLFALADDVSRQVQVFYSVIFPASGCFDRATAYLLARPLSADVPTETDASPKATSDMEFEIRHRYSESLAAQKFVEHMEVDRQTRWRNAKWECDIHFDAKAFKDQA